jgi:hypothetical protein
MPNDILKNVPVGEWSPIAGGTAKMPTASLDILLKLRGVIERALEEDQKKLAEAREKLTRLRYGGGS